MHIATKSSKIDISTEEKLEQFTKNLSQKIKKGDIFFLFGEMGVVSEQSRMANAATVTDCDLLFVSRDEFEKMLDESHIVVKGILRILSERLRTAQMPKK